MAGRRTKPPRPPLRLIARTNAAEATKEEFLHELNLLKKQYEKTALHGRNRTCYSLLYESESFYLAAVRDIYTRDLDEIVTDIPAIYEKNFRVPKRIPTRQTTNPELMPGQTPSII